MGFVLGRGGCSRDQARGALGSEEALDPGQAWWAGPEAKEGRLSAVPRAGAPYSHVVCLLVEMPPVSDSLWSVAVSLCVAAFLVQGSYFRA